MSLERTWSAGEACWFLGVDDRDWKVGLQRHHKGRVRTSTANPKLLTNFFREVHSTAGMNVGGKSFVSTTEGSC